MLAAGFGQGETRYDQVIGFHTAPELTVGDVGLAKGPANASFDIIHIIVPIRRLERNAREAYAFGPTGEREAVLLFNERTKLTAEATVEYMI